MNGRLVLLLMASALPATGVPAAEPLTAEAAIEVQKRQLQGATGIAPCAADEPGEDIVVCGRRPTGPPPVFSRVEGQRTNMLPGELPRAEARFNTCVAKCHQPVAINHKQAIKYGGRIVRHILGKDD